MFFVKRSHHNPILTPERENYWEDFATFNMSVLKRGKTFYGVYRAIGSEDKLRTPERISIIGLGRSLDGRHFEERRPFIRPEEEWEKFGCEDPRLTYFEGKYYIFYTALSKYPFEADGIKVAVGVSDDLETITERHLVTPFNAKAMTLFPDRIGGKVTAVLTVNTDRPPAAVALAQAEHIEDFWDPKYWETWYKELGRHTVDLRRNAQDHTEVGSTPLKTSQGWLLFYAHIQNYFSGGEKVFGIEAVLLDLKDPSRIVGRTSGPLLAPLESYELLGYVPDVIFPSGAVIEKDTVFIYYGASDTTVCLAHINLSDLLGTICNKEKYSFKRSPENPILVPNKENFWESQAVFNPAAIREKGITHIIYRAFSGDNTSSFGYAATKDGEKIIERLSFPVYLPREDFEQKKVKGGNSGCEDPRLAKIGDKIYMCYTAYDGIDPPRVAVTSITLKNFLAKNWQWEKPVLITPAGLDDKDTCILPDRISGKYFILHRVGNEICGDYLRSLDFKKDSVKKCIRILEPRLNSWDNFKVGITAPPIKTKYGWLLLYHGISKNHHVYRIGAALLDLKDPALVLARSTDPIFEPVAEYEKNGLVPNVVFPCGMTLQGKKLYLYYGGGDQVTGVATMDIDIILKALSRDLKMGK